jgi:hypothetical protein
MIAYLLTACAMIFAWAAVVLLCASDPFGHESSWGWRALRRLRRKPKVSKHPVGE